MAKRFDGYNWTDSPESGRGRQQVPIRNDEATKSASTAPDKITDNKVSKEAKKEFIDGESSILSGSVNCYPDPEIKSKSNIRLSGLGKYLSGVYFVEQVKHTFSGSGYSQSLTVSKNGFGSLKGGSASTTAPTTTSTKKVSVVEPKVTERTHTLTSSDTLYSLAIKYYGSGSQWVKIAKANNLASGEERRLKVGTVLKIPV